MSQLFISSEKREPSAAAQSSRTLRLAYFVSHPIQYQAPLLRRIAQEPDIDLTVYFSSDISVREFHDPGFGTRIQWDVPLLDGYKSEFLPRLRPTDDLGFARPLNWGIFSRLRRGRFDAVWVFGYAQLFALNAIVAARLLHIPVLIRTDSSLIDRRRSKRTLLLKSVFFKLLKPALSSAVAVGKANQAYWKHHMGADFPVITMPYAVDNDFFRKRTLEAASRREELRRELELKSGRPVILYASKLLARKRCIDLVEAYLRLPAGPGIEPHPYLLIVGDGEERSRIEARVRESGLSSIRFLGFRNQTELPRLYDLCDIFVLPSILEPWGLIVNEVMNAGRPIVVSDQVGCQLDLVQDGLNGFVYPALDIDALTLCLRRLLDDPELRASMGENSLRLIQQYSFEQDVAGLRQALAVTVPDFAERRSSDGNMIRGGRS